VGWGGGPWAGGRRFGRDWLNWTGGGWAGGGWAGGRRFGRDWLNWTGGGWGGGGWAGGRRFGSDGLSGLGGVAARKNRDIPGPVQRPPPGVVGGVGRALGLPGGLASAPARGRPGRDPACCPAGRRRSGARGRGARGCCARGCCARGCCARSRRAGGWRRGRRRGQLALLAGGPAPHPVGHQQHLADPGEHRSQSLRGRLLHPIGDLRETHFGLLPQESRCCSPGVRSAQFRYGLIMAS
jgi:hypothetical protein